ncbi:MAG: type B 50S ribosomal protein L31 [Gammaproteobacteria bacterium AqS3]|nr:type B 50S ribosomal protein L31 [Gammaproteobacteria bacterium AqS3]
MKSEIHPKCGPVLYRDISCDQYFLIHGVIPEKAETAVWEEDGKEYPLVNVEVSSASHPFYTGAQRLHTADGRVAKFQKRFGRSAISGALQKSPDKPDAQQAPAEDEPAEK